MPKYSCPRGVRGNRIAFSSIPFVPVPDPVDNSLTPILLSGRFRTNVSGCTARFPTLEISARYFDRIEVSFFWGYPFETYEDFLCALDLAAHASQFALTVNVQLHMLIPLPSSPIYQEFKDTLIYPEAEDSRFLLLLPALLLDERARIVRGVIEKAPHLYPGFFTLPTPEKEKKRAQLNEVFTSREVMIGIAIIDDQIHGLWTTENKTLEKELINFSDTPSNPERIGTGLALGVFKRLREKKGKSHATQASHSSTRLGTAAQRLSVEGPMKTIIFAGPSISHRQVAELTLADVAPQSVGAISIRSSVMTYSRFWMGSLVRTCLCHRRKFSPPCQPARL
jgi:hypothetical protein